jgi:hypothetical protein
LEDIASYLALLHGHIDSRKKALDEIAEEIADGELDDCGDPVQPYVSGRWEMKTFSRILCSTTVAAICTYADVKLLVLAREDFMRRQRGNYPIRSERREACKLQLPKSENVEEYWKANQLDYARSAAWSDFKRLKQIRNHLIHSNGYLEGACFDTHGKRHLTARIDTKSRHCTVCNRKISSS